MYPWSRNRLENRLGVATGKENWGGMDWSSGLADTKYYQYIKGGFNRHEFAETLGDGERQESLVCCIPGGGKELDMTKHLDNNK